MFFLLRHSPKTLDCHHIFFKTFSVVAHRPKRYRVKRHHNTPASLSTTLRNAYKRKLALAYFPNSNLACGILDVLINEGYINGFRLQPELKRLTIYLKYSGHSGLAAVQEITTVSKPSNRVFKKAHQIRPFMNGLGIYVVKTIRGVKSCKECWEKNIGGEVMFSVF
ncbi:hypothetical protein MHBO_003185 [Bonamia ostreae]|uniref:Ribosomal protein S8 n=1 Tax=Bonamia ostreae TaxID=126728 RepID=A0ABV2APQ6_9EUKA